MEAVRHSDRTAPPPVADGEGILDILIVHGASRHAGYLQNLLESIGAGAFRLVRVESQTDALRYLGSGRFGLAFIDYVVKGSKGVDLIRAAGGRLCPTPMVLVADAERDDAEEEGLGAGAADFLKREDMTPAILRRVIRYARFNHNATRKLVVDEQRHRELAETAAAASDELTKFMAHMSHELRTPLNAIIGFSEVIQNEMFGLIEGEGARRYREYIRDIHSSSQHLLSLINDLLDLSKIEAGRFEIAPAEILLSDVIRDAVRMTRQQAKSREVALVAARPDETFEIYADRRLVTQALLNVTANAVKFTGAGGRVSVTARAEGPNVVIAVVDDGCGIAAEELPSALEPFQQAGPLETRPSEGTGLGLPLARSIMELHQGGLEITSEPGKGTSVFLWLPKNVRGTGFDAA